MKITGYVTADTIKEIGCRSSKCWDLYLDPTELKAPWKVEIDTRDFIVGGIMERILTIGLRK